jgi:Ca2+-transporting ATPase
MAILPEEFPVILAGVPRARRLAHLAPRRPHAPHACDRDARRATVLCVDKTGTLTENRMSVVDTPQPALDAAALACPLDPHDPMDRAIVAAASAPAARLRSEAKLEKSYPLSDRFLAVCNAWRVPGGRLRVAIKGAPETVLALCGNPGASEGCRRPRRAACAARGGRGGLGFEPARRPGALPFPLRRIRQAGRSAARLGPGRSGAVPRRGHPRGDDHRRPSRDGAAHRGRRRHRHALGRAHRAELARWTTRRSRRRCGEVNVFARVRPEHKLRLVQAYRAAGEVVAMTGDGVNDAPALKAAHIGVAMGRRGTDVAREAAHLVLLEDDFGSIVETVRLGRRIYDNIRNAMRYIISVHVPTAGMSFLPLALGGPLFLFPVHVVFLEFVIDPACTLVYEAEKTDAQVMQRPPRDPREPLFNLHMLAVSLALGGTMLLAVLAVYVWSLHAGYTEGETRAAAFAAIVAANVALIFVTRSRSRSAAAMLREPNPRCGGSAPARSARSSRRSTSRRWPRCSASRRSAPPSSRSRRSPESPGSPGTS